MPNIQINGSLHLYDLLEKHLFIFLLTTTCDACKTTLEVLSEIRTKYEKFNFVILVNTPEGNIKFLRDIFGNTKVFNISLSSLQREFNVIGFPWGYGINQKKEIITSSACSSENSILALMEPFSYIAGWEI